MVFKKIGNKVKNSIKNAINPMNIMQSSMMRAMGIKPKSKVQVLFEKLIGFIKSLNLKLLFLTDKIVGVYNKYISGKPAKLWFFIKLIFSSLKGLFKSVFGKIKAFYKKDKKRAIIYFILLYILYRLIGFCCYKITSFMKKDVNKMVVLTRIVEPERAKKEVRKEQKKKLIVMDILKVKPH